MTWLCLAIFPVICLLEAFYLCRVKFDWRMVLAALLWPITLIWCVQRYVRGVL